MGKDVIIVIASAKQFTNIEEILRRAEGGFYSETVSNTRGVVAFRGVGVVPPTNSPFGAQDPGTTATTQIATDTCFIVSHSR